MQLKLLTRISRSGRLPHSNSEQTICGAAAQIIRDRKYEFDAWLVSEAGKTWAEAEADVSEAIDFCEFYARQALKLARPDPPVQLSGERDEMVYLPLGVGVIIPPWNFPLAILVRDDGGGAGYRQHGGDQTLERHADDRSEIRGSAARSRVPGRNRSRC